MAEIVVKSRSELHLSRKIFHICSGTLLALLYAYFNNREFFVLFVAIVALLFLPLDYLRTQSEKVNKFCFKWIGFVMRENEKKELSGQFYYILGWLWLFCFCPRIVVICSLLLLAWMDPIASLVGIRFGRIKWIRIASWAFVDLDRLKRTVGGKTLEGSLVSFLVGAVLVFFSFNYFSSFDWSFQELTILSLAIAFVGFMAEMWPSQWDDNARIPFWVSLCSWLLILYFERNPAF